MGSCQCRKFCFSEQANSNLHIQEVATNDDFRTVNQDIDANDLFIRIKTWQKESFSLFDYENPTHLREQNFQISKGGYLIKNNDELQWIDDDVDWNKSVIKQEQILFRIEKNDGVFTIINKNRESKQNYEDDKQEQTTKYHGDNKDFQQSENLDQEEGEEFHQQSELIKKYSHHQKISMSQRTNTKLMEKGSKLWLVVKSMQSMLNTNAIKLKEGDVIKMGRVKFKVREIQLNQRQLLQDSDSAKSSKTDAITCRVCCSSAYSRSNPLVNPCKCTGSVKYIHLNCLKKWLKSKFQAKQSDHCIIYMWKNLECELCKFNYPPVFKSDEGVFDLIELSKPTDMPYILLEITQKRYEQEAHDHSLDDAQWNQCNGVYIVTFESNNQEQQGRALNELKIGRANETEIRVNDISVSRNHGTLKLIKNNLYLTDNKSKFGTLILIQQGIIPLINELNGIEIQVGRSVLQFTLGNQNTTSHQQLQHLSSEIFEKIIGRNCEEEENDLIQ